MLEPPEVKDEIILGKLDAEFGITATVLQFVPLGEDSQAWVYRAETADGGVYLLKLRRGQVNPASLAIPRYLQDHGMPRIAAPLSTRTRAMSAVMGDLALTVYPFVAGRSAHEAGMSEEQWVEYGTLLRQLHGTTLPTNLLEGARPESYRPKATQLIMDLDAAIGMRSFTDPVEEALVAVWRARRGQIRALTDRAGALGLRLRQAPPPNVVCHADIHTANLLLDAEGQLWIVDWDEVMLAPKERDLMFVVGGLGSEWVNRQQTAWFFRGYGRATVDPVALAYYRYDWAAQDVAEFAARVVLRPELGTETKRSALGLFLKQFDRGSMIEMAESSRLA